MFSYIFDFFKKNPDSDLTEPFFLNFLPLTFLWEKNRFFPILNFHRSWNMTNVYIVNRLSTFCFQKCIERISYHKGENDLQKMLVVYTAAPRKKEWRILKRTKSNAGKPENFYTGTPATYLWSSNEMNY